MTLPSLKDQELSKIEQEHQPKDHKISVKLTDSIDTKKITLRHITVKFSKPKVRKRS